MFDVSDFSGWPSGDNKPLLELRSTPSELTKQYGLQFRREKDDLDWFFASHFIDVELGPVVMLRYENSPAHGTLVYVDAGVDSREAIVRLESVLELDDNDIVWRTPGWEPVASPGAGSS